MAAHADTLARPTRAGVDGLAPRIGAVASDLRCPECAPAEGRLIVRDDALECVECGHQYPVEAGCPVLLSHESRRALNATQRSAHWSHMVAEYAGVQTPSRAARVWGRLLRILRPPEVLHHTNPDLQAPHTRMLFTHRGAATRVLNVGGGPHRYSSHEVTLNLAPFANVDLAADAHTIPFADATFDTVICNAVLEHVYDAERIVAEMVRVLRPGGYLYAEIPFLFFFHGYPNDFKRYTAEGVKRLFADLVDMELHITNGPVSVLLQTGNMVMQLALPARPRALRKVFNGLYRWLLFPLKYLDLRASRHVEAHTVAGGFAVLGRNPEPASGGQNVGG